MPRHSAMEAQIEKLKINVRENEEAWKPFLEKTDNQEYKKQFQELLESFNRRISAICNMQQAARSLSMIAAVGTPILEVEIASLNRDLQRSTKQRKKIKEVLDKWQQAKGASSSHETDKANEAGIFSPPPTELWLAALRTY